LFIVIFVQFQYWNEKWIFSSEKLLLGLKKFGDNGGYVKVGEFYDNFKLVEKLENRSQSLLDWNSFCLVLNKTNNSIHVSINGDWIKTNFDVKVIQNFNVSLEPFITVGKYVGKMTDLNVWNEPLSQESIKNFSTGVYLQNQTFNKLRGPDTFFVTICNFQKKYTKK